MCVSLGQCLHVYDAMGNHVCSAQSSSGTWEWPVMSANMTAGVTQSSTDRVRSEWHSIVFQPNFWMAIIVK